MIEINIPGHKQVHISKIVMDYNGTMAVDGYLIEGVRQKILKLVPSVAIHIITADTFGRVREQLAGLPVKINVLENKNQAKQKEEFIRQLNPDGTVAIGNGRNDALMLNLAEIGIAVIQEEGAAVKTLLLADIVVKNINDALDLFIKPGRLIATMRK